MLQLRPYQTDALAAVLDVAARGQRRLLIALPTGTGKTVIFSQLIAQRPGRALVLVHRDELLQQAYAKLKEIRPTLSLGLIKAERDEHDADCVLASVQTLSRVARLRRLTPDFATLVIDEAHHAVADSYRRILQYCGAFSADGPLTLGVTATPRRSDQVGLDAVFEEMVFHKPLLSMIEAGYLADLRALQVTLKVDFHQLHTRAGDVVDREVEHLLLEADAPTHLLQAYLAYAPERKALLFTPTVQLAHTIAAVFRQAGVAAEALDGALPLAERRALLQRLHTGATRVVANCGVLTEGYDEPSIDCVILARPTRSATLFTQMIGRGTRRYPGKADCLVIDVVGASTRHDLMSVASLTGLPVTALQAGASVAEAAAERTVEDERQRRQGAVVARTVDLFSRRTLHWLPIDGGFTLSLGQEGWLVLTPEAEQDGTHWRATVVAPDGARLLLASGLSLAYAQGAAEDFVRDLGVQVLSDPQAAWRRRPASDKQRWLLRKLRLPSQDDLTAGEASDLIAQAKMHQALQQAGD